MHPNAQWFEGTDRECALCTKRATGILRGYRNENIGPRCRRCADKEIAAAHRKHKRFMPDIEVENMAVAADPNHRA